MRQRRKFYTLLGGSYRDALGTSHTVYFVRLRADDGKFLFFGPSEGSDGAAYMAYQKLHPLGIDIAQRGETEYLNSADKDTRVACRNLLLAATAKRRQQT